MPKWAVKDDALVRLPRFMSLSNSMTEEQYER